MHVARWEVLNLTMYLGDVSNTHQISPALLEAKQIAWWHSHLRVGCMQQALFHRQVQDLNKKKKKTEWDSDNKGNLKTGFYILKISDGDIVISQSHLLILSS